MDDNLGYSAWTVLFSIDHRRRQNKYAITSRKLGIIHYCTRSFITGPGGCYNIQFGSKTFFGTTSILRMTF